MLFCAEKISMTSSINRLNHMTCCVGPLFCCRTRVCHISMPVKDHLIVFNSKQKLFLKAFPQMLVLLEQNCGKPFYWSSRKKAQIHWNKSTAAVFTSSLIYPYITPCCFVNGVYNKIESNVDLLTGFQRGTSDIGTPPQSAASVGPKVNRQSVILSLPHLLLLLLLSS